MIRREGVPLDPQTLCPVIPIKQEAVRTTALPTYLPPWALKDEVQVVKKEDRSHWLGRLWRFGR